MREAYPHFVPFILRPAGQPAKKRDRLPPQIPAAAARIGDETFSASSARSGDVTDTCDADLRELLRPGGLYAIGRGLSHWHQITDGGQWHADADGMVSAE